MDSALTTTAAVIPFAQWFEARGVARATAFRLLKISGITAGRMKVPSSRVPVAAVDAAQVAILDRLAARLADGATLPQLEAEITTALAPTAAPKGAGLDDPAPSDPATDAAALLARLEAGERAIRSGLPLSTSEVAWILGARPGAAVVTRAGVEAIRHSRNCWQLRRNQSL